MFDRLSSTSAIGILFLASLFVSMGCERAGPLEIDGDGTATLSTIQARIFDTNCAVSGCHTGNSDRLPGNMNLSAGQAYNNIVNVPSEESSLDRVEPGEPEMSYLLKKIRGDADIDGARMPFGRPPLSPDDIALIEQWIDEGALNN